MCRPLDRIVRTFKGTGTELETGGSETAVGATNKVPWESHLLSWSSPPSSPKTPTPPKSSPLRLPPLPLPLPPLSLSVNDGLETNWYEQTANLVWIQMKRLIMVNHNQFSIRMRVEIWK